MTTLRYHLDESAPPLVEIDWSPQGKEMAVRARGQPAGVIASREALLEGCRFDLAGGETLLVRIARGAFAIPEVTLGGQRLYLAQQSPTTRLNRASTVILFMGAAG